MTADDFVKIVRAGSEKLRVDGIVLNTGEREVHGKGMLIISREEIELDMTLEAGENPPAKQTGVLTKSDYWKLSGTIEDGLQFKCDYVSTGGSQVFFHWNKRKEVLIFDLNPIELVAFGWDALSREQHDHIHEELRQKNISLTENKPPEQLPVKNQPTSSAVCFRAKIYNYPIRAQLCQATNIKRVNPYFGESNGWRLNTLMGEIEGFTYAFIKEDDDADF